MVLHQSVKIFRKAAVEDESAVMHAGFFVCAVNIDIGFRALPQRGGGMLFSLIEVQAMIQYDQIRAVLAAVAEHGGIHARLFRTQLTAHAVDLEQSKVMLAAKVDDEIITLFLFFRSIAEAVGAAPETKADAGFGGLFQLKQGFAGISKRKLTGHSGCAMVYIHVKALRRDGNLRFFRLQ